MPNMSYCRWHNTSHALQDCANSIEDLEETNGFDELADFEQQGMINTLRAATRLLAEMPVSVLAAANIDLSGLPNQEAIREATPATLRYVN